MVDNLKQMIFKRADCLARNALCADSPGLSEEYETKFTALIELMIDADIMGDYLVS